MDLLDADAFPALSPSSAPSLLGAFPSGHPPPPSSAQVPPASFWKDKLSSSSSSDKPFPVSFVQPVSSTKVSFSATELAPGQKEWELCLVGHAIGRRPYYGAVLAAVRRQWKLKGALDLLSFEGDFFLFKFSCREDYEKIWDAGHCFLNGRPFIFKKWTKGFKPVKEECSEIPLWIKFPNFPLCCWNEEGISKVASLIGVPLAVDQLTAAKTRISFARVCVQINPTSPLPESILLDLDGEEVLQPVLYDWKPLVCHKCNTFSHGPSSCPLNPPAPAKNRGRSKSRGPPKQGRTTSTGQTTTPIATVDTSKGQENPLERQPGNISDLNQPPIASPEQPDETPGEGVLDKEQEQPVTDTHPPDPHNPDTSDTAADTSHDDIPPTVTPSSSQIPSSPSRNLRSQSQAKSPPTKHPNGPPHIPKPTKSQSSKKGAKIGNPFDPLCHLQS